MTHGGDKYIRDCPIFSTTKHGFQKKTHFSRSQILGWVRWYPLALGSQKFAALPVGVCVCVVTLHYTHGPPFCLTHQQSLHPLERVLFGSIRATHPRTNLHEPKRTISSDKYYQYTTTMHPFIDFHPTFQTSVVVPTKKHVSYPPQFVGVSETV